MRKPDQRLRKPVVDFDLDNDSERLLALGVGRMMQCSPLPIPTEIVIYYHPVELSCLIRGWSQPYDRLHSLIGIEAKVNDQNHALSIRSAK